MRGPEPKLLNVEARNMRRLVPIVILLAVVGVISCTTGGPSPKDVRRFVIVSFDGLGADLFWSWFDEGILEEPLGFQGMVKNGRSVKRLRMVNPTLTTVNHISLITGREPSATGIVSNSFRYAGSPINSNINGFSAPFDGEALWTLARRQKKRVGVLLWPGSDATRVSRMGDFGVMWPVYPLLPSAIIDFDPGQASAQMEFSILANVMQKRQNLILILKA